MSYRIVYDYGEAEHLELPVRKKETWKTVMVAAAFLAGVLLGRGLVREFLLPENSKTVQAFSEVYSSVYKGESLWDSIKNYFTEELTDMKYGQ